MRLKLEKCQFFKVSVEYMGHMIDAEGVHASGDKIKAIQEAPVPKNITQLRAFLGLLNYYGKFLKLSLTIHSVRKYILVFGFINLFRCRWGEDRDILCMHKRLRPVICYLHAWGGARQESPALAKTRQSFIQ